MSDYTHHKGKKWSNFDVWHKDLRPNSDTRVDIDHVLWCTSCQGAKAVIEEISCRSTEQFDREQSRKPVSATLWTANGRCPVYLLGMDRPDKDAKVWLTRIDVEPWRRILVEATSDELSSYLDELQVAHGISHLEKNGTVSRTSPDPDDIDPDDIFSS